MEQAQIPPINVIVLTMLAHFSWMLTIACCQAEGLWLELDSVLSYARLLLNGEPVAFADRSSLRKSTCEKTRSTEDCVREREARTAVMKQIADRKHVADVRRLTQDELLAEAKITEKINLRSLGWCCSSSHFSQ